MRGLTIGAAQVAIGVVLGVVLVVFVGLPVKDPSTAEASGSSVSFGPKEWGAHFTAAGTDGEPVFQLAYVAPGARSIAREETKHLPEGFSLVFYSSDADMWVTTESREGGKGNVILKGTILHPDGTETVLKKGTLKTEAIEKREQALKTKR